MAVEWSGLSPELLLTTDREAAEPLRSQLERQLRDAIRSGRLGAGERLPSTRALSKELGLSRGLVQDCYAQLQAEGYLSADVGSATRVAAGADRTANGTPGAQARSDVGYADRSSSDRPTSDRPSADFASGVPDLASFPRADWSWAVREACRAAPNSAFNYGDPRGSLEFREVLAAYLRRVRAAAASPDSIVVCTGFAQGLNLILRALVTTGVSLVAFEDPGYNVTVSNAAARAGIKVVPVPVNESGVDVSALDASGARAVVLTPAHQWPTGVVLSPQRRLQLIKWAADREGTIIEDDYDAEFRYDRDPVGALQGLAPERVAAIGTVSKSLAPSLRLGWIVCPPGLADVVIEEKALHDRGSPVLDQLALALLVRSGRFDRHLRRMRASYAHRRAALVDALAAHAPEVSLTGLAAGFHAVAHLPGALEEETVIGAARERSVGLYGMSEHRSDRSVLPAQLVLGFGNLTERAIASGIAAVGDLLRR
ncbi:MAG: PLP-dependent aminotransferase family protein [Nocardiopsaceae bacterium]|jgi:GntR family transcriptional regulator/MocR family aminotransferase|nr:PLP-dependent aminotransferase family protein [Nocardiopsaceae bacterium]